MRLALSIAYDGTRFYGSARQPEVRTVEGSILDLLVEMEAIESAETGCFQAASRTDAGVSAAGNVVAFNTDMAPGSIVSGLAYGLEDIWPLRSAVVDEGFAPRHARCKTYRYYLYDEGYDHDAMHRAARCFEGTHDLSAFARLDGRSPVRGVEQVVIHGGDVITIDVVGGSFLWQQVRRMVAALQRAGQGELQPSEISEALRQPAGQDFGVAAPEYLLLLGVEYDVEPEWTDGPGIERLAGRLHTLELSVQMHVDMARSVPSK